MTEHAESHDTAQENGAVARTPPSSAWTRQQIDLIKNTVAKGTSDDELALFIHVCQRTGLDPLARQIYAIKRGGQMTIQTGIDGYRLIAARSGEHAGTDDAVFDSEEADAPRKASTTVYRFVKGYRAPFTATARWSEYAQESPTWKRMPYLMLQKCSESLALRKAFPAELSGLYTHEEMEPAPGEGSPRLREEPQPEPSTQGAPPPVITPQQLGYLMGVTKQFGVSEEQLMSYLGTLGYASRKDIPKAKLDDILRWVKQQKETV